MKELCQEIPGVSVEFQKDVPHPGRCKDRMSGICELGPLVRIEPLHYQYVKVREEDCMEIFQRTVLNHEPVEHLFYKKGGETYASPDEFHLLPNRPGLFWKTAENSMQNLLTSTIASGGYDALTKALFDMTPEDVLEEVDKSKLRGRGGGGFRQEESGNRWQLTKKSRFITLSATATKVTPAHSWTEA